MDHLAKIGSSLGINKSPTESMNAYYDRVIYSATAAWMLTSVFFGEDNTGVSQIKSTSKEKMQMLYMLTSTSTKPDTDLLTERMYETLLANGAFLHRKYYVRPAPHRLIGYNDVALVRGMLPEELVLFSGMAPYTMAHKSDACNVYAAFGLPPETPQYILKQVWDHAIPAAKDTHIDEYLDTKHRERQNYYCQAPVEKAGMLFGRSRRADHQYDYYLIRDGVIRRISEDHIAAAFHEYARLYLMTQAQEQVVRANFDGNELVHLSFTFHLPKPDLRFLQYLSWPTEKQDLWNFSLQRDVWPIVKERLEFLNYKVVEDSE